MPTRLFLRNVSAVGDVPLAKQASWADYDPGTPSDKNAVLALDTAKGAAATEISSGGILANSSSVQYTTHLRRFISPGLPGGTVIRNGQTVTAYLAAAESSGQANYALWYFVYVWRPGVGKVKDLLSDQGTTEVSVYSNFLVHRDVHALSLGSDFTLQSGDRVVIELWVREDNTRGQSYTAYVRHDGTNESYTNGQQVSNPDIAAFAEFSDNLFAGTGTASASGGGVAQGGGKKDVAGTVVLSGGGAVAASGVKARPAVLSGGGSLAVSARKGGTAKWQVTLTDSFDGYPNGTPLEGDPSWVKQWAGQMHYYWDLVWTTSAGATSFYTKESFAEKKDFSLQYVHSTNESWTAAVYLFARYQGGQFVALKVSDRYAYIYEFNGSWYLKGGYTHPSSITWSGNVIGFELIRNTYRFILNGIERLACSGDPAYDVPGKIGIGGWAQYGMQGWLDNLAITYASSGLSGGGAVGSAGKKGAQGTVAASGGGTLAASGAKGGHGRIGRVSAREEFSYGALTWLRDTGVYLTGRSMGITGPWDAGIAQADGKYRTGYSDVACHLRILGPGNAPHLQSVAAEYLNDTGGGALFLFVRGNPSYGRSLESWDWGEGVYLYVSTPPGGAGQTWQLNWFRGNISGYWGPQYLNHRAFATGDGLRLEVDGDTYRFLHNDSLVFEYADDTLFFRGGYAGIGGDGTYSFPCAEWAEFTLDGWFAGGTLAVQGYRARYGAAAISGGGFFSIVGAKGATSAGGEVVLFTEDFNWNGNINSPPWGSGPPGPTVWWANGSIAQAGGGGVSLSLYKGHGLRAGRQFVTGVMHAGPYFCGPVLLQRDDAWYGYWLLNDMFLTPNALKVVRHRSGTWFDYDLIGAADGFYTGVVRMEVLPQGTSIRIKVWMDGVLRIDAVDENPVATDGYPGLGATWDPGTYGGFDDFAFGIVTPDGGNISGSGSVVAAGNKGVRSAGAVSGGGMSVCAVSKNAVGHTIVPTEYVDDFERADGPPGNGWAQHPNLYGPVVVANRSLYEVAFGANERSYWQGRGIAADQEVSYRVISRDGGAVWYPAAVGLKLGCLGWGPQTPKGGYLVQFNYPAVSRWNIVCYDQNGDRLNVAWESTTRPQHSAGDIIKATVLGDVVSIYRNGVLEWQYLDAGRFTGNAGYAGLDWTYASPNAAVDDFTFAVAESVLGIVVHGGGTTSAFGRKWTFQDAAVHGRGTVAAAGQSGVAKSVVLQGTGVVAIAGRKGAVAAIAVTARGEVTATYVRTGGNPHDAYIPGGGRLVVVVRKEARAPPIDVSASGRLTAAGVRIYTQVQLRAPAKELPVELVLLHLDFCTRTFGVAPCLATGTPCFNTWATCRYPAAFAKTDRVYRFSSADVSLPFEGPRPYVRNVKYLPTEIKTNLTVNARVTVEFVDEPDSDVDTDPYVATRGITKASFWKRMLSRNPNYKGRLIEVYEGFLGQREEEFVKKWVGKIENVTLQGNVVKVESSDLLKDLSKIEVPPKLDIKLLIDLPAAQTEGLTVSDVSGLDASGYVRIGDEIVRYESLDVPTKQLKILSRGHFGTVAVDHKVKDKVQKVRYFAPANPWDILLEMLQVDAGIPGEYIDADSFSYAKEWPGGDIVFRGIVSEPEKLDKLFFEIVDLLDAKAWVAEDLRITVRRNIQNEPGRLYYEVTDDSHILHGSTAVDLNEKSRLSRMFVYWHKKVLGKVDDPSSYDRLDIAVDADAEEAYGDTSEKKLFCRWIDPVTVQEEAAESYIKNLAMRQVRRNRTAQPIIAASLGLKDGSLKTGQFVRLSTDEVVRPDGSPVRAEIYQVVKREVKDNRIAVSLIRLSQRKVCFIAPAGTPGYAAASDVEREYGFVTDARGQMEDESPGYHIW